jgi:hypothetical protein
MDEKVARYSDILMNIIKMSKIIDICDKTVYILKDNEDWLRERELL